MSNGNQFNDVIVVGAGASGLGVGIVLKKLGIDYVILEKDKIGSSFRKWPAETRFISPSFTGNFFKMVDLNAISPETSPAFNLLTEHPSGREFSQYLEGLAEYYELNIATGIEVKDLRKEKDLFNINTNKGEYKSRFVIWAAGEYQYPKRRAFEGDDLCSHYSEIKSFSEVQGEDSLVIGAYESGFDAAVNLVKLGKKVTLLDSTEYIDLVSSDSSYSLSPFTRDRIRKVFDIMTYCENTRVTSVKFADGTYTVATKENRTFTSKYKPINCTGFDSSLTLVKSLFEFKDKYPLLTDFDESTKTENLFLVGPQVKHSNALFCFIYKYRQRFAIVGERIASMLNISSEVIQEVVKEHKDYNFYLDDLSCCDNACAC